MPSNFKFKIQHLQNLNISTKVFAPIIIGFVFLVLTFGILITSLLQEKTSALESIASTRNIVILSNQLADSQNQVQQAVISYRLKKEKKDWDLILYQDGVMLDVLDKLNANLADLRERKLLDTYKASELEALTYRGALIDAINNNLPQDQIDQAYGAWLPKVQAMNETLRQITTVSASLLDRDTTAFRNVFDEVIVTYVAILLITIMMIVLLYSYLRSLIIKPIDQLTQGARHIADGNLNWTIKAGSLDEIGKLSEAFIEMTKKLANSYEGLRAMAFSDPLTGLPNRQALEQKLQAAITQAQMEKNLLGIIMLDVDRFKKINDTFGHDVGDKVLKEIADRLLSTLRPSDSVIRLGGDEFIIVLPDLKSAHGAVTVAKKILKAVEDSMVIGGRELYISGSLGVAFYPGDGENIVSLLKAADIALYGAKASGRNRYNLYNKITDLRPQAQMELENDLRTALKNDQFKVYYQPLINLQTGKVVAVEALLRWQHPDLGMLLPHEFIPLAEECGVINQISPWALKTACQAGKEWEEKNLPAIQLAVNLSPRQFLEKNLVENISKSLQDTGFEPQRLALEITESLAMANLEHSREKLRLLSQMGIAISVDDFGTGYSSLSYLKDFPVNKIKIDHSFIRQIITEPHHTAIVKAIITMGHNLNLVVAAEGVEADTQLALLKSLGCDEAQGYYIGRPMQKEDLAEWLAKQPQQKPEVAVVKTPVEPIDVAIVKEDEGGDGGKEK